METKYCAYSVLSAKGKRKNNRRSCKKTSNPSENSDLCEVLNKRCGLKENHDRRVSHQTNSKRVSPKKKVISVQPRAVPRKTVQRQAVVEELPVAPKKVQQKPVVVEEKPVVVEELLSSQSKDINDYDKVVKKLHEVGEDVVEYGYDNEFGPPWREEDYKEYKNKQQLFEEIQKHYGSKMVDIKKQETNSSRGTQGYNRTTISVNPNFKKDFAKLT